MPKSWWGISQADQTGWAHSIHEPKRSVSRQCVAEKGAGAPAALQDLRAGKGSNLWIHRGLLQSPAQALRHWISDATTGLQLYDLENGRIGAIVILPGNRDEVQPATMIFFSRYGFSSLNANIWLVGSETLRRAKSFSSSSAILTVLKISPLEWTFISLQLSITGRFVMMWPFSET